jgi:hypothetical protein
LYLSDFFSVPNRYKSSSQAIALTTFTACQARAPVNFNRTTKFDVPVSAIHHLNCNMETNQD